MELKGLVVYDDGVTRVNSALIANHYVCGATEEICNLPFAFIAPLGTNYNYVSQKLI